MGDTTEDGQAGPRLGLAEVTQADLDAIDMEALAEAYNRGLACEKSGDVTGAVAAYRETLELDPLDRGGASLRLAVLGAAAAPVAAPPFYVATLFNQNAATFDETLVDGLGYAVPIMVRETHERLGLPRARRLLDLGCGTGLAGESLRDRADHVTGLDLAEEMLAEAAERGAYDALFIGEASSVLPHWAESGVEPFDLIVACDVLPYAGNLEPLMSGIAGCLAPGGHLAVSTETLEEDRIEPEGWALGTGHRYVHGEDYLRERLEAAGLEVLSLERIVVRSEDGAPVPGHLVVARRG